MKNNKAGTYTFDEFANKEAELNRLIEQASLVSQLEFKLIKAHGLSDGMKVLDAACGPGIISCMISQNLKNANVTGIDINDNLLEKAKQRSIEQGLDIRFMKGDIYDLPFEDEFDFAYCRFLFQHLENPMKAIQAIYKALKPGGKLCIVDVDDDWLTLYPELPEFKELCDLTYEAQKQKGGDRYVGRKLRSLIKSCFKDISVNVQALNSDEIGVERFLNLTTDFKKEFFQANDLQHIEHLFDVIKEKTTSIDYFGIIGIYIVSGTK
ncbi:MAG: class I SAM-dependent methyltransferase [Bacillota bacterium]|nr:class I SAM-dependent methyltransferase [Bacillota bacterium]